jgi:hypothetical protein
VDCALSKLWPKYVHNLKGSEYVLSVVRKSWTSLDMSDLMKWSTAVHGIAFIPYSLFLCFCYVYTNNNR